MLSGAPSAAIDLYSIYIVTYGTGNTTNRTGLIRVLDAGVEYIVEPYSFDSWVTLAKDGSNIVATFKNASGVNRVQLKKLIF